MSTPCGFTSATHAVSCPVLRCDLKYWKPVLTLRQVSPRPFTRLGRPRVARAVRRAAMVTARSFARTGEGEPGLEEGHPLYAFIVNPQGGNGSAGRMWRSRVKPQIQQRLGESHFIECVTEHPRHAEALAEAAVLQGVSAVVACGGDGTINEVVNGMMRVESKKRLATALAVLPLGTGCDFVRTFGWSKSIPEALDRLERRQLLAVDVGRAKYALIGAGRGANDGGSKTGTRYFINIASLGVSAKVCEIVHLFKWLGSAMSYAVATVVSFFLMVFQGCTMRLGEGSPKVSLERLTCLVVANAQYFGGGLQVAPNAKTNSGTFNVVALQNIGLLRFLVDSFAMRQGKHLGMDGVTEHNASAVDVDMAHTAEGHSRYEVELDGEVAGALPVQFTKIGGALNLCT
mmetsp:Transcript_9502/g.34841  ORF Transcript_9502/g.34841 Transcript_9502/m.34841 type:complete len:402 (-) Transcript_9502:183-1388(-)